MNFVEPNVSIITEPDYFKRIELAGRTCYKSECKITPDSAYPFYQRMIKSGHESVIEHSNIIIRTETSIAYISILECVQEYESNTGLPAYIRYTSAEDSNEELYNVKNYGCCIGDKHILSGNFRAWRNIVKMFKNEEVFKMLFAGHPAFCDIYSEADHIDSTDELLSADFSFLPKANDKRHDIITAKFICDRGVMAEMTRHRTLSFSVESTRYVNYEGDGCTFIQPEFLTLDGNADAYNCAADHCEMAEQDYNFILKEIDSPQIARCVLPNMLKTEMVVTGTIANWEHFVALRSSKAAHPDMQVISNMFKDLTEIGEM